MLKNALMGLAILCCFGLSAQKKLQNQPLYETRRFHFGFSLGINYWDFHIQPVADLTNVSGFYDVKNIVSPGYNINIISNLRLSKYWDLRFNPGFASTNRQLSFDVVNPLTRDREEVVKEITSSSIEFPLELKFRAMRVNNYSMNLLGGIKYNKDLASKETVEDDQIFKIKSNDLYYEFGVGFDIYFEFFKFSPQIKASWGFADLLVEDGTIFVQGIDRLESRCILINFTFE